jgi:hypothetical protein
MPDYKQLAQHAQNTGPQFFRVSPAFNASLFQYLSPQDAKNLSTVDKHLQDQYNQLPKLSLNTAKNAPTAIKRLLSTWETLPKIAKYLPEVGNIQKILTDLPFRDQHNGLELIVRILKEELAQLKGVFPASAASKAVHNKRIQMLTTQGLRAQLPTDRNTTWAIYFLNAIDKELQVKPNNPISSQKIAALRCFLNYLSQNTTIKHPQNNIQYDLAAWITRVIREAHQYPHLELDNAGLNEALCLLPDVFIGQGILKSINDIWLIIKAKLEGEPTLRDQLVIQSDVPLCHRPEFIDAVIQALPNLLSHQPSHIRSSLLIHNFIPNTLQLDAWAKEEAGAAATEKFISQRLAIIIHFLTSYAEAEENDVNEQFILWNSKKLMMQSDEGSATAVLMFVPDMISFMRTKDTINMLTVFCGPLYNNPSLNYINLFLKHVPLFLSHVYFRNASNKKASDQCFSIIWGKISGTMLSYLKHDDESIRQKATQCCKMLLGFAPNLPVLVYYVRNKTRYNSGLKFSGVLTLLPICLKAQTIDKQLINNLIDGIKINLATSEPSEKQYLAQYSSELLEALPQLLPYIEEVRAGAMHEILDPLFAQLAVVGLGMLDHTLDAFARLCRDTQYGVVVQQKILAQLIMFFTEYKGQDYRSIYRDSCEAKLTLLLDILSLQEEQQSVCITESQRRVLFNDLMNNPHLGSPKMEALFNKLIFILLKLEPRVEQQNAMIQDIVKESYSCSQVLSSWMLFLMSNGQKDAVESFMKIDVDEESDTYLETDLHCTKRLIQEIYQLEVEIKAEKERELTDANEGAVTSSSFRVTDQLEVATSSASTFQKTF